MPKKLMMNQNAARSMVREIMTEFANQTGLSPATKSRRRYLWTDAFAVCTFLELYRQTNDEATNREASSWTEHLDINMVMLATSLTPDGYLTV